MRKSRVQRYGILLSLMCTISSVQSGAQDYINTRKISLYRGDTSVIAGLLSDIKFDKVDPEVYYYWYGHEQILSNQGGYSGHLLHGEYLEYGPSGSLLLKGDFEKGKRSGLWIYWYKDGAVKETRQYEKGMLEGKNIIYSPEGKIIQSSMYHDNLLHGEMTTIENDTIFQIKYKKGEEKKRKPLHVFEE